MATRRLYYDDSFARDFSAQVLSCEPVVHQANAAWEVVLDATALYPNSGGQPYDLGKLGEANVLDVRDDGDEIVHIVDREVDLGAVHGCVDWARRFDHMQQHTGQHLLSAMFQERFGRPTVSFHLGCELSTIDLRGDEPSDAILEGAERAANQVIFDDRPVTVRYGTAEQFAEMGVRKEVDRQGILRAIEIEGADLQPCGGTHVKHTAQIGMMLVRRCTKMRQDWHVEFVCGGRAERIARKDFLLLRRAAEQLGCAYDEVADSAGRVVSDRDGRFKEYRGVLQRLAEAEATLALQAIPVGPDGLRVVARAFREDAQAEYLGHFASQLAKSDRTIALLSRTPCGHLFFAQHPSAGRDMNALLKQVLQQLGGKGGGTRDFARGRLSDAAKGETALVLGRELVAAG
ncbi:MAG: alanyl-tRNA editing protein [Candidatus Acidiferrum sp.]|jgi:alanyl-tRNA synthetase